MSQTTISSRRVIVSAIKLLILAVTIWFVWGTLRTGLADLEGCDWRFDLGWLAAAGGLYITGLLPAGLFWRRVLTAMGQRPTLSATLRAYYIGHLGKYVPGKMLVVVLRTGLLAERGVLVGPVVVAVFVETLTMMAVGAALAAAIGAVLLQGQPGIVVGGLLLMLASGVPTLPPVLNRILKSRWMEGKLAASHSLKSPASVKIPWNVIFTGWLFNIVGWFILGLSLWAVLRSFAPAELTPLAGLPRYTAAVSLAMVAGFLSGLPGGIGVRDVILVATLAQLVPSETALVAAILLRVVWLVSEVVISGILYFGGRGSPTVGSRQ